MLDLSVEIEGWHGAPKAKAIPRNPKVSLCVLDEQWRRPTCRSTATSIETDEQAVVEVMVRRPRL